MKFLVIGCGSIGKRHIGNLQSLGQEVLAVDPSETSRKTVEEKFNIKTFDNLENALNEKPDAVFICTPTSTHFDVASSALDHAHVFVEKPVCVTLEHADKLKEKAKKNNRIVQVGYNLRYTTALKKVKELLVSGKIGKLISARLIFASYLPQWRPGTDYRKSYSANKSMGGGIILDASHELDYVCWLMGKPTSVTCVANKISNLDLDVEDNADIILVFENGSVANIHLDYLRQDYTRECELVGEKGTIICKLDFKNGKYTIEIKSFDSDKNITQAELIAHDKLNPNDMYVEEVKAFIAAIEHNAKASPDLEDGVLALAISLKALEASEKEKTQKM